MIWQNKAVPPLTSAENSETARKTVRKMLMIIPILVAGVLCYAVTVFAWFQDSLVNSGNIIQAGQFSAAVEITQNGQTVWSSANNLQGQPAGILGCDAQVTGFSAGEAILTITNNSDSTLSFQYAMLLTENDIRGTEVELKFDLLQNNGMPTESQDSGQVLQPGWSASYAFSVSDGISALYLQFRTAFVANSAPTFAVSGNAAGHSIQRVPTASETTIGGMSTKTFVSTSTSASAFPIDTQTSPTAGAETTGTTAATSNSQETVSTTISSAATESAPATETEGRVPAVPSESSVWAAETTSTVSLPAGETAAAAATS